MRFGSSISEFLEAFRKKVVPRANLARTYPVKRDGSRRQGRDAGPGRF